MDFKKSNAPLNTVTRDLNALAEDTGNIYETVCIIAKRANQIAVEMKHEISKKLEEYAQPQPGQPDINEEYTQNADQIEISRRYERMPKPTLIATQEYIEHKIHFRNPAKDHNLLDD